MKKQKFLQYVLACTLLILCTALCTACGGEKLNLEDYFSKEEIKSWKKEQKEYKYTMNGGYFISFKGELYPVNFENGKINWLTTPPIDMALVEMYEFYTDAGLTKRCSYLGRYKEERLFGEDILHRGFLLDGKRLDFGSVLYMDENRMRSFKSTYGKTPSYGLDDEIVLIRSYDGKRAEYVFYHDDLILSDSGGVFLEELNTFRKIWEYAKENNIPFDAYTEYTNLPYPSSLLGVYDDSQWMDRDSAGGLSMSMSRLEMASINCISMRYLNENYQDFNCMVFTDAEGAQEFLAEVNYAIANQSFVRYRDIVMDDRGLVMQCNYKYFYGAQGGVDNSAQVHKIFYSCEEFNRFLQEQCIIDYDAKTSMYFSREENGEPFDGYLDYNVNSHPSAHFEMYAVWKEYHAVQLHTPSTTTEEVVCINKDLRLPNVMQPGYEFEGWYADESYSGQPITMVRYADSYKNLYAKFRKVDSYTLTFEPYEGKTIENIQYVYGNEFALPMATKSFHIFKGWCIDPECKTEPVKAISPDFYGSYHLYPCFEPIEYTITLHFMEKTLKQTIRYGEQITLYAADIGRNFVAYFDQSGLQYTDETGKLLAPFTDGADIHLFAKYKEA